MTPLQFVTLSAATAVSWVAAGALLAIAQPGFAFGAFALGAVMAWRALLDARDAGRREG